MTPNDKIKQKYKLGVTQIYAGSLSEVVQKLNTGKIDLDPRDVIQITQNQQDGMIWEILYLWKIED